MKKFSPSIRLYYNFLLREGIDIIIEGQQTHYLKNVMRLNVGSRFFVFNGKDGEFGAEIINLKTNKIFCKCIEKTKNQTVEPDLWLLFSVVKKERIYFIIEKGTELGVTKFFPILTNRTQMKSINYEKLKSYCIESSEQTERLSIPKIRPLEKLKTLLLNWPNDRLILFCDENGAPPIMDVIYKISVPIAILIGPEGGFSDDERNFLTNLDFVLSVSLGPRVLRSDTAAISALSCFQSIKGDWRF